MKARILQKLLETDRTVHWSDGKVCVASAMCHDLISYNPATKKLKYALGYPSYGKPDDDELSAIWGKLEALIKSGEIHGIISGNDDTAGMIPVFEAHYGEVLEEMTDKIEWPNVTHTGKMIYNNTHFDTFEKAAGRSLSEAGHVIESGFELIERLSADLKSAADKIRDLKNKCEKLKKQLKRYG